MVDIIFVSFCVKTIQVLSTESSAACSQITSCLLAYLTTLGDKKIDTTRPLREILRGSVRRETGGRMPSGMWDMILNKSLSLFTKSAVGMVESKPIGEQPSSFTTVLQNIVSYTVFIKDVMQPMFRSETPSGPAGDAKSELYLSVTPLLLSILLSSLAPPRGEVMDPMVQVRKVIEIAELGRTQRVDIQIKRLKEDHKELQLNIPTTSKVPPPDILGEMILSAERDARTSSTPDVNVKVRLLKTMMTLIGK